jgi:hypothetical protein
VKNTLKVALAATVVLGAGSAAHADHNINRAVGLPLNPTAQIPEPNGVRLQANYYDLGSVGPASLKQYGLYASGRIGDNIEINGGVDKLDTSPNSVLDKTSFAIGAKYLFTRESDPAGVRIAAGVGYDRIRLKQTYGYIVASKYLTSVSSDHLPVVGHLGVRYDHFNVLGVTSNKASVYAGLEAPITRTGEVSLVGEIGSKETQGGKSVYSAGLRYRPSGSGFSVGAGWMRDSLSFSSGFFANLGYTFSTGESNEAVVAPAAAPAPAPAQ